jgi:hypothetical protein
MCVTRSGNVSNKQVIQGVIYFIAGGIFSFVTLETIMLWMWGVPPHPLTCLGFLSSLTLICAGITTIAGNLRISRLLAVCALGGLTPIWLAWVISLVPQHNTIPSPLAYLAAAAYLLILIAVLFYSRRLSFAVGVIVAICSLGSAFAIAAYVKRASAGEYNRPEIGCFRWYPDRANALSITRDTENWIDRQAKDLIESAGIHGRLEETGGSGAPSSRTKVIVLAQRKPPTPVRLYYPRKGTLIYAFDGTTWRKIPGDASTYPTFFTLEDQNDYTMLYEELSDGSRQGIQAFTWR